MGTETDQATPAGLRRWWEGLRWYAKGVLGESVYDNYLAWHQRHGCGEPMTRAEYWRRRSDHQERNPQGRCC